MNRLHFPYGSIHNLDILMRRKYRTTFLLSVFQMNLSRPYEQTTPFIHWAYNVPKLGLHSAYIALTPGLHCANTLIMLCLQDAYIMLTIGAFACWDFYNLLNCARERPKSAIQKSISHFRSRSATEAREQNSATESMGLA